MRAILVSVNYADLLALTLPYNGWLRHWRGRSATVGVVWPGEKK